jgi:hypothetical protein
MFKQRKKNKKLHTAGDPQPAGCSDANDSGARDPATRNRPLSDMSTAVNKKRKATESTTGNVNKRRNTTTAAERVTNTTTAAERVTALETQMGFLIQLLHKTAGHGHITSLSLVLQCVIGFCHDYLCFYSFVGAAGPAVAVMSSPATTPPVRETGACFVDVDTLFVVTLFSIIAFVQVHWLKCFRFLLLRSTRLQQLRWAERQVRALLMLSRCSLSPSSQ